MVKEILTLEKSEDRTFQAAEAAGGLRQSRTSRLEKRALSA